MIELSIFDPVWSKPASLSSVMLDPLGLDRTSDRMKAGLLIGIISLTDRARYYSFYSWVIKNVNETENFARFVDFRNVFLDRVRSYCLACISHSESNVSSDHSSLQGLIKGRPKWREGGRYVQVQGFRHLGNPLGGYGYYYQASMNYLGLTEHELTRDVLTPLGRKLADAFEQKISDTQYFKKFIGKEAIPRDVFQDYGSKCCICLMSEADSPDRNILREIMFNLVPSRGVQTNIILHKRRKQSLSLILFLVSELSKYSVNIDEVMFLDSIYFGQFKKGMKIISIRFPQYLNDVVEKWRLLRCHDYFSYACETLLTVFLKALDAHRMDGLSFEDFMAILDEKRISDKLGTILHQRSSKVLSLNAALNQLTMISTSDKKSTFSSSTSKMFDEKCRLELSINESNLLRKVEKEAESNRATPISQVATSVTALLVLFARFYHKHSSNDSNWSWLRKMTETDLSPYHLIKDLEPKVFDPNFSIHDFLFWIYKEYIIKQSETVFYGKINSLYSIPKPFFHKDKNAYRVDRLYSPRFRDSRFSSSFSILRDLNLCKKSGAFYKLTLDGDALLERTIGGQQ